MRRKVVPITIILLVILIVSFQEQLSAKGAAIKISSSSFTLEANHYKTLYISGTSKKAAWSSSNKSVATVTSGGKVVAKAPGAATIYANVNGKRLSSKVNVIKLSSTSTAIAMGSTKTLKVNGTSSKVIWSTTNKNIATVSSTGVISPKNTGKVTIYGAVAGKKLSCVVTVIKLNATNLTMNSGKTFLMKAIGTTNKITWSSTNSGIATITSNGTITAKGEGSATITASVLDTKMNAKVTVNKVINTSKKPTKAPTSMPTITPTKAPTITPTSVPTVTPTITPVITPTQAPTQLPVITPTPTITPYPVPTQAPTIVPIPTPVPTLAPTPTPTQSVIPSPIPTKKIIGYYAAWSRYSGFTPDKLDANKLTHINYAFADIGTDLKIKLGYPDVDPANISGLNQLKQINPNLKTIISVGGYSWSGRFSDVALSETSRAIFADSCVDFIVKYGFDGIDLDWEYPVSGGLSSNVKRPEDKHNFTLLLQTLREKLNAKEVQSGKHYILTFAGAAGAWYLNNIEPTQVNQYVDYVNVMSYDLHGPWETYTNFNAPLYSENPLKPNNISADKSVKEWILAGFTKNKIVMGVPFYGYIYQSVPNVNNGFNQIYSGASSITYSKVVSTYLNASGYKYYYNSDAKVPWLFNGSTFITYENELSMTEKAQYIKNNDLGGAMIWELSQDPNKVLLNSLYQILK